MNIKENSIIVCDRNTKRKILKQSFQEKKLFDYTFITPSDFKNRYYFKITDQAVVFAMQFLSMSYANAKQIINSIYYIDEDITYTDSKLMQLQVLKRKLIEEGLLEFDLPFIDFIKGKNIYLINIFLDKYMKKMFKEIEDISTVNYLFEELVDREYQVVEFAKYDNEVDYVFYKIYGLLNQGIDINKIYIVSESSEYNHLINRYSNLYKIPVFIKENESIKNHVIIKEFLSILKETLSKETALERIGKYNNSYVLNSVVKCLNRFYFVEDIKVFIEVLEEEFSNINYEDLNLLDVVNVVDLSYHFTEDDYVFVIGFNNNTIPKSFKDDNYLFDKYKDILTIDTSYEKNELERNKAVYLISKINNITLTYSKVTATNNLVSTLTDILPCVITTDSVKVGLVSDVDRIKLGIMLDELINFNTHNPSLDMLFSSFDDVYKSYDNRFDFVDEKLVKERLDSYISLSYSSISKFYKCQFYYYLERVLKIKRDDGGFALQIGNIFHEILEKYGTDNFDLETEKNAHYSAIEDESLKFYFNKLWPDFLLALDFIDEFKSLTYLKDELHEQTVEIDYSTDFYQRFFTGKIDKIMYTTIDGVDYVSIVDYKTGKDKALLDNVDYGFNLQLPVYAYFLAKTALLKNPKIIGIYLHRILNDVKPTSTKTLSIVKRDALKLDGYSLTDRRELELFDPTYKNSQFLRGMSMTKDGSFARFAKVFSDEDISNLITTVERLILEAFEKIESGSFVINPKKVDNINLSCGFCPYKNICYKQNRDINEIKSEQFKETIVGDE